ncbi:hypothetical protein ACIRJO_02795 [Streptomyces sp. NPDC102394]|uniref:hypothetical protein n=1 Tax=Streptomyces sp. NPDC102394 TaxID=3366167 RepID=UPI00382CFB62
MTNLDTLLALCAQADADRRERERNAELEDQADAVKAAIAYAEQVLGSEAAAALGEWAPIEMMDVDTWQAFVQISTNAYLRCTAHMEDGTWLELVSHCPHCGHCREERVTSLAGLAVAMSNAGAR